MIKTLKRARYGYKIVKDSTCGEIYLVELHIPVGTMIFSGRKKCRAAAVIPTRCWMIEHKKLQLQSDVEYLTHVSNYGPRTKYKIDKVCKPNRFSKKPYSCSNGIHFYYDAIHAFAWYNANYLFDMSYNLSLTAENKVRKQ